MDNNEFNSRRASLSPAKRALLDQKLKQNAVMTLAIPRRASRDSAPLSFAQQRLWFLDQLEPESTAYNEVMAIRLEGDLHVQALRQALNTIVERHEVLRTTFALGAGGDAVQWIGPVRPADLPVLDLGEYPEPERSAQVQRAIAELRSRKFDLAQDLLLRAALVRLETSQYIFAVVKHHIASDGWSSGIFWRELAALYGAYSQGQLNPLPELAFQYADFAVWQRQWLQGEELARQLTYWTRQLEGVSVLALPTDRPRPAVQSYRGAKRTLVLPPDLLGQVKALSSQERATLFMTLLAVFQVLLHRYTGQDDIAVGTPIAGRVLPEVEELIGFFVNTLVLRSDLSGNPTFKELLTQVRDTALQAYEHQDLPFEKLVEELQPERNRATSPLFQVLFVYQNTSLEPWSLHGLALTPIEVVTGTAKFDLLLSLKDSGDGLRGYVEYSTDLFDGATIERMIAHFTRLLEEIVVDPARPISSLPLLSESERRQMLIGWNDTSRDYSREKCVHELFEAQVERAPQTVAVEFDGRALTYGDLNRRANQLARYLRIRGVKPESFVAICMERSLEMAVAVLAVMKAGAAYLPLDPEYPRDRLAFMLDDAKVSMIVTTTNLLERGQSRPAESAHCSVVCLDGDGGEIAGESGDQLANTATASSSAYVIYTSGSTGSPKGVVMEQGALVNLICWQLTQSSGAERTAQFASLSFDVSFQEMFSTWCAGGTLVLIPPKTRRDPSALWQFVTRNSIARLFLPYVALQQLADAAESEISLPTTLREIITAGEQLQSTPQIARLFERLQYCRLINQYGPTESHVVSSFRLDPSPMHWPALPPIGRPIHNAKLYILDAHLQPVPIGAAGELYIAGVGLARGYLNQPKLTAEKFLTHAFDGEASRRLYKTGDRARYLPDGNIEFLGRMDTQVKIRGYRIELGEIEAVLGQHPAVREAIVLAREDSPGGKRLIAYVVSNQQRVPTNHALRSYLKEKLPEYMVPSVFVLMESLPLTSNGKVDRRALPAPAPSRPELDETFSISRTSTEELLANLWAEVLKLEKVGIYDNFFDLGGHSLMATQVMSRLTKAFQVELPLRSLFESPTVAGLAERIDESRRKEKYLPVLPILPMPRTEDLPLSFAQQRLWFLDQLEPNSSVYNIPSAQRLKGRLDIGALEQSLNEIVRRHQALRTTFSLVEGQPVQRISPSPSLPLSMIDLSQLPESEREDEVRRLTNEEAQRPFDLERGPLARSVLLHLGDEDHILVLTLHHIASDGWSMSILHRELSVLYEALSNGKPSPLEPLSVQYADFAQWQREWLQGAVLGTQLGYWKKQLNDFQTLQLPTDRPPPAVPSYRGARQSLVLSKNISEGLKSLSRQQGVTLFMTLLAAFQTLLYRYTGQEDIAVGSPIAGRNRREMDGLIGFFVNTLVLRTDLSGDPSFLEVMGRVRECSLGAYAHQDLPFEKLVEELRPTRNLSQNPLIQVMFILQNAPRQALEFAGLTMNSVKIDSTKAKFDLTLSIQTEVEGLRGALQYSSDLFNGETITRMLGHFEILLENIVANPKQAISALPILTDAERCQLTAEWNDTKRDYPSDKCIHELFEQQVENNPDTIAVVFETQHFTYRELNSKANQLAHYLRKQGVGPDTLVGVCMERSADMVTALLGILKAGGAYVPLDPSYPTQRLGFMLEDTRARIVLSDRISRNSLPPSIARVVCLERDWEEIAKEPQASPSSKSKADNLAYVIYTSGSTGLPKGVEIRHRGVVRLLFGVDYVQLDQAQTFLHVAPISFDAATFEVWGALLHGAKCVLFPGKVPAPSELGAMLKKHQVTTLWLTAALFNTVINDEPQALSEVKQLLIGGEALSLPHVRKGLAQLANTKIINGYGPTESTTFTCCYGIPRQLDDNLSSIPIGKPIGNTQVYILDPYLNPVPIGVAGELHIGGDGLARDYLNRSELTAEKFIGNPFSNDSGARLYKTGDLARYLPDGNIEYLGRLDNQVKLRGYRIELGEIEAVLGKHPAVRESAVLVREEGKEHLATHRVADNRLIAYIVKHPVIPASTSELRGFLQQMLPEYMLPSAFVFLDALPLTPNGKLDRTALPAPNQSITDAKNSFVAARSALERIMVNIWADVLRVERVSIDDNFFDLGGYSLLGIKVLAQIKQRLGLDIPTRCLFESPTVAQLVNRIEVGVDQNFQLRAEQQAFRHLLRLRQGQGGLTVFCFPFYGGFKDELLELARLVHLIGPEYSFYALVTGPHAQLASRLSVEKRAKSYSTEIRQLQPHGPYFLMGDCLAGPLAYETAQQLQAQGEIVSWLALWDVRGRPPSNFNRYLGRRLGTWLNYYLMYVVTWKGWSYLNSAMQFHRRELTRLKRQERWHYILHKATSALGKVSRRQPEQHRAGDSKGRFSVRSNSNLKAAEKRYELASRTYDFRPYRGKLTIIANGSLYDADPTMRWTELALSGLEVKKIPGNHDTYIEDNLELFLQALRESLKNAISK